MASALRASSSISALHFPCQREEEEEEEEEDPEEEEKQSAEEEEETEAEAVFDSGRPAADDGLFSDFEQEHEEEDKEEERPAAVASVAVAVTPISERKFDAVYPSSSGQGTSKEKQSGDNIEIGTTSREGNKRQRTSPVATEEETNLQDQLIEVLKRNSRMLTEQLESQNLNCQLDREQRKDQTNSVIEVLGKLADAIGKIADKL